jgi:SAM-dependent methyltransferase
MKLSKCSAIAAALLLQASTTQAFAPLHVSTRGPSACSTTSSPSPTSLRMGLDLVTYIRTEWVSAALVTNQTPRSADVCLQLGTADGRAIVFVPRTIREFITSSAEADGTIPIKVQRQLKQQAERRSSATIKYVDQPADNLKETQDESVDVVISLQAADRMRENGLDWKKSVREAARVLKPGGRFLFVEQTELEGESYLEYVMNLVSLTGDIPEDDEDPPPLFDDVGYDDVDLVLTAHVAGVAVKNVDAGMSVADRAARAKQEDQAKLAELSLEAYERGLKKRKRKKKKKAGKEEEATA